MRLQQTQYLTLMLPARIATGWYTRSA